MDTTLSLRCGERIPPLQENQPLPTAIFTITHGFTT
ncbi:hypothetical protein A2U01_0082130, partial [Trifolium medium]|nr:hypothetical protein [Trifolium medium]